MRTIWKFELPIEDEVSIDMPEGAEIIHIGNQRGRLCIWADVLTDVLSCKRNFIIVGTSDEIARKFKYLKHIGTVFFENGDIVFHVFENIE